MVLDYHLHLLRHGEERSLDVDWVREYAARAGTAGVLEIAVTEHLFRFPEAQALLDRWWVDESDGRLRAQTERYLVAERVSWSLGEYVDAVLEAAGEAGPVSPVIRLGLEVDYYPGRMDEVCEFLARFPFDLLLGSVHWLGAFGFDQYEDPIVAGEWEQRSPESVWDAYVGAVEAMAASGACDVLAHVDLAKVTGVQPPDGGAWHDRLAKAAAANDLCVELSSAGWRKPVGEPYPAPALVEILRDAGVGITLASDAHEPETVADRLTDLVSMATGAGYTEVCSFEGRNRRSMSLTQGPPTGTGGA